MDPIPRKTRDPPDDFELESWARRIRDRAVRRCSEMLRTFDARSRNKNESARRIARISLNLPELLENNAPGGARLGFA